MQAGIVIHPIAQFLVPGYNMMTDHSLNVKNLA